MIAENIGHYQSGGDTVDFLIDKDETTKIKRCVVIENDASPDAKLLYCEADNTENRLKAHQIFFLKVAEMFSEKVF